MFFIGKNFCFQAFRTIIWITAYIVLVIFNSTQTSLCEPQVPCYCIFGDSLVDNGNNNNLTTMAKANYPPYGIDFPDGPTGRFTNSQNIADILAKHLGFDDYIPPFATAQGQEITKCVNYGSGASGIRDETGSHLGDRISFNRQLLNHQTTISRLATILGSQTSANEYLSKCLYTVGLGSNDYINNYLMPQFYPTSRIYTPDQYAQVLIQQYSRQLTRLYKFGARKIAVFGLGPIGCTPVEIEMYGQNQTACVDSINFGVQLFNNRLKALVDDLNANLSAANFTYINIMGIQSGAPAALGLRVLNQPCCKVSTSKSRGQCIFGLQPCLIRTLNVFWDNFHPSEVVNLATASRSYNAFLPSDAYPKDIHHLVRS